MSRVAFAWVIRTFAWVKVVMLGACLAGCGGGRDAPPATLPASSSSLAAASSSLGQSSSQGSVSAGGSSSAASSLALGDASRGQSQFLLMCASCHGERGQGAVVINSSAYRYASLVDYITLKMPKAIPEECVSECARNTATYILAGFMAGSGASSSSVSSHDGANWVIGAATKRLTADMLQASMGIVVGGDGNSGIAWTIGSGRLVKDGIEKFAQTLGRPDYVEITDEIREPTTLYAKLMGDLALDVCAKAIAVDYSAGTLANARNIVRFSSLENTLDTQAIGENIRYLKLRYHAQDLPPEGNEDSAALQQVFRTVAQQSSAKAGWQAVCVALLTSPQFHLY